MPHKDTPTLLVFTRGAKRERARKRLLPKGSEGLEARLYWQCLAKTLEAGELTGCRIEISSPGSLSLPADFRTPVRRQTQRGPDFGGRLRAALGEAFAAAPGPVIVVGTDVPGFDSNRLRQSLETLRRKPDAVVLGPSPDGGFYLLAARRPVDAELRAVRWCRTDTLSQLVSALERAGRPVVFLSPLADLDRRQDLEAWLALAATRAGAWGRLCRQLCVLLAALLRPAAPAVLGLSLSAEIGLVPGRAPPRPC